MKYLIGRPILETDGTVVVIGLSGSLRRDSYNSALLAAAAELAPAHLRLKIWPGLHSIPPYDEDLQALGDPESVSTLRGGMQQAQAALIATPEYNWGMPGQLKNALDWLSRPLTANPLRFKPVAIIGASGGPMGAIRSQIQVRQVLTAMDARVISKPEVLVTHAAQRFDADGRLVDDIARRLLAQLLLELGEQAGHQRARADLTRAS